MTHPFANNLRRLRREKDLTQDQLGVLSGISPRHIGKYEIGMALPRIDAAMKIADALGVSLDSLIRAEDDARKFDVHGKQTVIDLLVQHIKTHHAAE